MQFSFGIGLSVVLLSAALADWSLISLVFLVAFLTGQYKLRGQVQREKSCALLWISLAVAICTILLGLTVVIISAILGTGSNLSKYSMVEIIGLSRLNPSRDTGGIVLFFVPKLAVGMVASCGLYCEQRRTSAEFGSSDNEAFEFRAILRSFILPTVHVVAGSIFPCWVALPYFICSCTGLFHWSMTSNFVGLSWGWKPLLVYNGAHILLLYVRQLPIPLPDGLLDLADYVGLFKVSIDGMGWLEGLQAISLIALFILLCFAIGDMEDFDCSGLSRVKEVLPVSMMNDDEDNIHESLLQHTSPRETRSRTWWDSEQRRVLAFREAAFCFFAYGFPICVVALVCWSFKFESFCALVLLMYVGVILYVFPSLFLLRRLNGMLLGFILLWALSTYIFNAAFTIMTSNFKVDTAIWQTIGLWRYSSPGLFIMAQFALGVLVATDLFAGNNILDNQSEAVSVIPEERNFMEGEPQDRWILFMAVVVWCIHKSANVISLLLIFLVGLRSGLIHAVYMAFFIVYLLSSSVASKTRQYLMVYCELHLGVLYLLQLEWISRIITNHKVILKPVLSQLGIWNKATFHDYMAVAALLCFCAVQIHGIKVISSLSAAAQQSAETLRRYTPFLLSVSGSHSPEYHPLRSSDVNWITKHLAALGEGFRASYRSFGTYIVFATVLAAVYAAKPNYVSFGFLFLLLVWIIGRQILGKTESPFWIPLFVYTCLVFLTRYILSAFPDLQQQVGKLVRLNDDFGFDPKASLFWHLWDSLAILAVMQLYRYERSQMSAVEEPTCSSAFTTNSCKSVDFMKRLLILHSGKILSIAVFYASITPVGGFGFVYLLILVFTCNMRKSSALPAQLYAVYTGLLVVVEYLFQMFGKESGTYTGQVHGPFVHWLGLRVYDKGVWGIESGSQCKFIVLVACMVQYCSLQWLDQVPAALRRGEEPCLLFHDHGPRGYGSKDPMLGRLQKKVERLDSAFKDERHEASNSSEKNGKTSPVLSRLTSRESKKWNRRAMILKQEKYEAQWQALTIWSKYVHEHFFTIYGVEVNMITLLVGGFAVLNIFSLVYVFILALCIVLSNRCIRKLWPCFVFLFACILVSEYAVLADFPPSWNVPPTKNEIHMHCHDCWKDSNSQLGFCWKCWLGAVDDRQMLVAYFMVFIISSFQLRANNTSENSSLHSAGLVATERLAWSEISYETTEQWTWLDHLRFSFYRHLLHVVLLLVFVTGTLQYDLLHLGYLAFSMVFFRMRTTIMKKRNTIFCFLRLYNFSLIVASLIFQAPFFGFLDGRGCTPFSIFGLSKYDYGFRITARSALVDITIFCLVSLQSRIFRTTEFGQVLRYLAAEQVEARAHAQEDKAAWKKEQLQRIREIEERKIHRRLQVDKMKMDMVPLQLRLDVLNSAGKFREAFSPIELPESFRRYADNSVVPNTPTRLVSSFSDSALFDHAEGGHVSSFSENTCRRRGKLNMSKDTERLQTSSSEAMTKRAALGNGFLDEIRQDSHGQVPSPPEVASKHSAKHGLLSGVTLFGDGVAQMHNLGNQALANLVGLLNLDHADSDDTSSSSAEDDGKPGNEASQTQSQEYISYRDTEVLKPVALSETRHRLSMIWRYLWSKVIANTDIVCYVLFVLVYVWNFSLLTLVYPASLFLYALLVNPGPTHFFWSAMLIYTEMSILLQYMYQIIVNHCGHDDLPLWLKKLGISGRNMNRSFVASVLPLFLVYLSTLVQSSIKARDGEWMFVTEGNTFFSSRRVYDAENQSILTSSSLKGKVWKLWTVISGACIGALKTVLRCWRSLTTGSEVPPHFVQVTLSVPRWPGDGIQPERIESAFNRLLAAVRQGDLTCNNNAKDASRVRVESLESGKDKDTALAVLEVIHAAPPIGISVSSLLTSLTPASDVASEIMKAKHDARLEAVGFPYPIISVIAGGKKQIDLYAYIFGTDLIAFLYVGLFYQSFIKNSPEFLDVYQLEDQFPKEFVFVLMTLFFLIVLDRVLYLTASAIGKVFYYFFTLVLYTSYVTSFVWGMEVKPSDTIFFQLLPLRGFYLLKALSLSLQALQLRYGLPHKSTLYEQFLMRRVNSLTWLGFRIYRALPFLFELRCVLDWSCTTTSFSMYDWLKLEDIYASLFLVQCDIKLAREKHQLGQKRSVWIKFCNGICLFFILICVIWAPMLIYSSGNPTNFVNEIIEAHAQIGIRTSGGSFTLYETQLCKLHSMSDIIAAGFDIDPNSSLASFDTKDVQLICCEKDANSLWLIPPPTLRNLVNTFDDGVVIISSWNFRRERPKGKEIVTFTGQPLEIGSLQGILNGTYNSVGVENLYPRYFRLTSAGEVRVLEQTDAMVSGDLTLNREIQIWWSFSRSNASVEDGCGGVTGPLAIAVSEEVPKGLIGDTLSKFNIWSLYITFVLAVGRFIRLQCADLRMRIPYENFPSCDRLKAICEDIYAARAEGELELEEGLFWTLVKIYRSPHILMEYTKADSSGPRIPQAG